MASFRSLPTTVAHHSTITPGGNGLVKTSSSRSVRSLPDRLWSTPPPPEGGGGYCRYHDTRNHAIVSMPLLLHARRMFERENNDDDDEQEIKNHPHADTKDEEEQLTLFEEPRFNEDVQQVLLAASSSSSSSSSSSQKEENNDYGVLKKVVVLQNTTENPNKKMRMVPVVVSPKTRTRRGVTFATVEIREHPIIVGDHPGVKRGVPLSIGWESVNQILLDLDRYEAVRVRHRRPVQAMRMAAEHREFILRALGYTREEILRGQLSADEVRQRRRKTNGNLPLDGVHEIMESTSRKLRNILTLGKFKRKQKEFLLKHVPQGTLDASSRSTTRSACDTWLSDSNRESIQSVSSLHHHPSSDHDHHHHHHHGEEILVGLVIK